MWFFELNSCDFSGDDVERKGALALAFVHVAKRIPKSGVECRKMSKTKKTSSGSERDPKKRKLSNNNKDDSILMAEPTVKSAQSMLRELSTSTTTSCGVIRGGASKELLSASEALCAKYCGQIADLHFWEGYEAEEGETVKKQFERQLKDCFGGENSKWFSLAIKFVHNLLAMYPRDAIPNTKKNLYYLRVQVNVPEACVKFHDDNVAVRAVTALCGESTVVSPGTNTNWKYWDETGGRLPLPDEDEDEEDDEEDTKKLIKDFNVQICSPENEYHAPTGDTLLLKGAGLTKRPCIHRAPYSADLSDVSGESEEEPEAQRLLVTLDYISRSEADKFIAMHEEQEDDEDDEGDSEEEEGSEGEEEGDSEGEE